VARLARLPVDHRRPADHPLEDLDQLAQRRRVGAPEVDQLVAARRHRTDRRDHTRDDVVDERVVAPGRAVAEQRDRLAARAPAIARVNLAIAMSGRWRGPYTVKNRSAWTPSPNRSRYVDSCSSFIRLVAAYGDAGDRHGSSSRNAAISRRSAPCRAPYTELDDANTRRCSPTARIRSTITPVPSMLVRR